MSRIIGITLLVIILIDSLRDSTESSIEFRVTKKHIRKCRCRVFLNGRMKCRSPMLPKNHKERMDLIKCLCSKTDQTFRVFKPICTSWITSLPITLV